MREIKFRARTSDGRWLYSEQMGLSLFFANVTALGLEPTQYIGLKDKNGKEAYHKDIVRCNDRVYTIEWHEDLASWYLKPIRGGWHGIVKSHMALICEIIGNIDENPKLLK